MNDLFIYLYYFNLKKNIIFSLSSKMIIDFNSFILKIINFVHNFQSIFHTITKIIIISLYKYPPKLSLVK